MINDEVDIMDIIYIIYKSRFLIIVTVTVISLTLSFIGPKVLKKIASAITIISAAILVFLIIRVETASTFSKPTVSERQAEQLVEIMEHEPDFIENILLNDLEVSPFAIDSDYYLQTDMGVTVELYDNKNEYYEAYDVLKSDYYGIGYLEAPDKQNKDYSAELQSNGYIEKIGKDGICVRCYPVFYTSNYKIISIYIPFKPGFYGEDVVIDYQDKVILISARTSMKYQISTGRFIDTLISRAQESNNTTEP